MFNRSMVLHELTASSRPDVSRGETCVVIAADDLSGSARSCLASVLVSVPPRTAVVLACSASAGDVGQLKDIASGPAGAARVWWIRADDLTAAVNAALALTAPADAVVITAPCRLAPGWLEALASAAHADSAHATASALSRSGTDLAVSAADARPEDLAQLAERVSANSLKLRPWLPGAVGPCVLIRREALELVGPLDDALPLSWALEMDFAQRCLLNGLGHVAADDVVVEPIAPAARADPPQEIIARHPHLGPRPSVGDSVVLQRALEAARRPRRLDVTIDGRALGSTVTGTQVHILEQIRALAGTDRLRLRVLVAPDAGGQVLSELVGLPHTSVVSVPDLIETTPPTTIFHRPQQVFWPPDLRFALLLGRRLVLNHLDLIAYRNPGYFPDAGAWERHRRVTRQAVAMADIVIVSSEHTRGDLIAEELASGERIRVIPPGLDHEMVAPSPPPEPRLAGRAQPFLLCLGTDFRHKNRLFALRLLRALRAEHGWPGRLVFAGTRVPHGSSSEQERDLLAGDAELRQAVLDLGPVDETQKAWLVEQAAALVYPSVYEGFGLVPFESALAGTPCVFAAQASLAEVLPAGAATIQPWNERESAAHVHALLTDPTAREKQIASIVQAARQLTWKTAAERTVEVYEEAAVAPARDAMALARDEVRREHELRELIAAHEAQVQHLTREWKHAQQMYDELHADVGVGLGLVRPGGVLSEDVQRALLTLGAHPGIARPILGATGRAYRAARALTRRRRR